MKTPQSKLGWGKGPPAVVATPSVVVPLLYHPGSPLASSEPDLPSRRAFPRIYFVGAEPQGIMAALKPGPGFCFPGGRHSRRLLQMCPRQGSMSSARCTVLSSGSLASHCKSQTSAALQPPCLRERARKARAPWCYLLGPFRSKPELMAASPALEPTWPQFPPLLNTPSLAQKNVFEFPLGPNLEINSSTSHLPVSY